MPFDEYQQKLTLNKRRLERAELQHGRLGWLRLLTFASAIGIAFANLWWLLAVPAVLFVILVWLQARIAVERRHAGRAITYYERGLDRLQDRWMGKGEPGDRFRDSSHVYADDLDLFGSGSLFELFCQARTRGGEAKLASWLLYPADPDEILARQQAIEEIRSRTDLREDLAALGEEFRTGIMPEELARWGEAPPIAFASWMRPLAIVFSVLGVVLLALFFASNRPETRVALVALGLAEALLALPLRARVLNVLNQLTQSSHDLDLLSAVLKRFERERFKSAKLVELRSKLDVEGTPASVRIRHLSLLADLLHSRDNLVVRMLGPLVLWTTQVAFAVERWRSVSGRYIPEWLLAVSELEALCSISGYAFEHPEDPFPVVSSGATSGAISGKALGHPLLPQAQCIRNDVHLGSGQPLVIISGSNMSGKSTYLRMVGVNTVLALAGAPVRAHSLSLAPLRLGASIRVTDSLQGGTSRFYAEITRLREIVRMAEAGPVLFLLDELLNGTNSQDRGTGAAGVVKGLVARGAIGLVTTHDLALTSIGSVNQHFEDHLERGAITFDYQIRPGVVEKSNALELMRAVGLEV